MSSVTVVQASGEALALNKALVAFSAIFTLVTAVQFGIAIETLIKNKSQLIAPIILLPILTGTLLIGDALFTTVYALGLGDVSSVTITAQTLSGLQTASLLFGSLFLIFFFWCLVSTLHRLSSAPSQLKRIVEGVFAIVWLALVLARAGIYAQVLNPISDAGSFQHFIDLSVTFNNLGYTLVAFEIVALIDLSVSSIHLYVSRRLHTANLWLVKTLAHVLAPILVVEAIADLVLEICSSPVVQSKFSTGIDMLVSAGNLALASDIVLGTLAAASIAILLRVVSNLQKTDTGSYDAQELGKVASANDS